MTKIEFPIIPQGFGTKRVVRVMQTNVRRLVTLLDIQVSIVDTDQFGWFYGVCSKNMTLDEVVDVLTKNGVGHNVRKDISYSPTQTPWDEIRLDDMRGLGIKFQDGKMTLQVPSSTDY
jgi:hypothetical protein